MVPANCLKPPSCLPSFLLPTNSILPVSPKNFNSAATTVHARTPSVATMATSVRLSMSTLLAVGGDISPPVGPTAPRREMVPTLAPPLPVVGEGAGGEGNAAGPSAHLLAHIRRERSTNHDGPSRTFTSS